MNNCKYNVIKCTISFYAVYVYPSFQKVTCTLYSVLVYSNKVTHTSICFKV